MAPSVNLRVRDLPSLRLLAVEDSIACLNLHCARLCLGWFGFCWRNCSVGLKSLLLIHGGDVCVGLCP